MHEQMSNATEYTDLLRYIVTMHSLEQNIKDGHLIA